MTISTFVKYKAKRLLAPLLFRYPPIGLQPERLHLWLDTLIATRNVPGAVVEIGCHLGGTAAFSARMMTRQGDRRPYVCIDTFGGFVSSEFEEDLKLGNTESNRHLFADNSPDLTRWVLDRHGAPDVKLIQGDIVSLNPSLIPEQISACLIDIDLAQPIETAMEIVTKRLAPGGRILVDDCPEDYDWQARKGYEAFMTKSGLTPSYKAGMGLFTQ
ncbi:MAG: class I SAM-dependent methyltransferase [Alphaproteobacteria bacterium]|nr:class I SAM-dependent methyltransferase [Alphaproteobacteria bacterium]